MDWDDLEAELQKTRAPGPFLVAFYDLEFSSVVARSFDDFTQAHACLTDFAERWCAVYCGHDQCTDGWLMNAPCLISGLVGTEEAVAAVDAELLGLAQAAMVREGQVTRADLLKVEEIAPIVRQYAGEYFA